MRHDQERWSRDDGTRDADLEAFRRGIADARIAVGDLRFHLAMRRVRAGLYARAAAERRFDPNQPRVPAGSPDGGRWTSTGTGGEGGGGEDTAPVVPATFMPNVAARDLEAGLRDAEARLRAGVSLGLDAALTLYNSLIGDPDPVLTPVIEVERSTEFPLDKDGNLVVAQVRAFPREEISSVCPSYDAIQKLTTQARDEIDAVFGKDGPLRPQIRGTAIHLRVKDLIEAESDLSHVKTEYSMNLAGSESIYAEPATVRVDELEQNDHVVCIYDTKTGRAGLTISRMLKLAAHAAKNCKNFDRIIITEMRP